MESGFFIHSRPTQEGSGQLGEARIGPLSLNLMSESFAELFEESFASRQIKSGAIITGTVVAVNDDVVIISAGLKSEAVIPIEQFQDEKGEAEVSIGDEFEVALDAVEDGFGETRLSREKAIRARTWIELEKAFEKSEIVQVSLTVVSKGDLPSRSTAFAPSFPVP